MKLSQDNQWSIRKTCAEQFEHLAEYMTEKDIQETLIKNVRNIFNKKYVVA